MPGGAGTSGTPPGFQLVVREATQARSERLGAQLKTHAEWVWAPLVYLLAVGYLYREVLAGDAGFGWDTIESYWPDLVYFTDEVRKGEWPLWNPYDRGGYPFAADPQPGLYYPLQWCFAAIGMVVGDTGWALIQLKMLVHHAIAGICMHAFLRHRGLPKVAALVGGIALVASHPWLIHKASNLLLPMVWTPLIWIATDRVLAAPSWRRSVALAGAIYLAGSAGSPPGFFYVLVMATLYGGFRGGESLWQHHKSQSLGPYLRKLAPAMVGAALLVFALLWVGLVPALELSEHTPRVKRDLAYALSMPLPLWPTLRGLIVPTAGHVDAYSGILVMMLAACALLLRPLQDRGAPIFFALASFYFLALSFSADLPLLAWFVEHVPGFGLFRIASRYKCVFAPMLAALSAYGAASLLTAGPRFSRDTWKVIALALSALLLTLYLVFANPLDPSLVKRFPGSSTPIVLTLLGVGLFTASAVHRARVRPILVAVMPLLMLSDPQQYWHHQEMFLEKRVDHREDLDKIRELEGVVDHRYRIYDEFALEQRPGSRLQVRDFRGYPSGDPLDFQRYRDVLAFAGKSPEILEAFNVRYVLHGRHHRNAKRGNRIQHDPSAASPNHFRRASGVVREAQHPVALVQWYGGITVANTAEVLPAVLASEDNQGVRRNLVLEPSERDKLAPALRASLETAGTGADASVAGTLVRFEADRVVVAIDAPQPGLVLLNEVNYPGWTPYVDGKVATNITANYLLRAVAVSAGPHRIEWRYAPPGHSQRRIAYLLGLLALLLAFASKLGIPTRLRALRRGRDPS